MEFRVNDAQVGEFSAEAVVRCVKQWYTSCAYVGLLRRGIPR